MIFKQPNGLYGRVSRIVEAPTHIDLTESDLHDYLMETMQFDYLGQSVEEWLSKYQGNIEDAIHTVTDMNLTQDMINEWEQKIGYK